MSFALFKLTLFRQLKRHLARFQVQNDQLKGGHATVIFIFCNHFQEGSISMLTVVKDNLPRGGWSRIPKLS